MRRVVLAVMCGVLAAVSGGVALGWWVATERAANQTLPPGGDVVEVTIPAYSTQDGASMPDLRGLDESAAREVLADLEVPAGSIGVSQRPAAGAPGVVIEQSPAFGLDDLSAITLVLAAEAVVPPIDGRPGTEIVEELSRLGAQVNVQQRYVAGTAPGVALQVSPEPGQPVPAEVALVTAEPASSVFVSELERVNGSCSIGEYSVNGTRYTDALSCSANRPSSTGTPSESSWIAGRAVDSVSGVVGVADNADAGTRVEVSLYADNVRVASVAVGYGAPAQLQATTTGALRLTIRATDLTASTGFGSSAAVLADLRAAGGASAIAALTNNP